ncbi:MAG: rRNA maturation RNase YbeY, partial [Spirochaeta sp.]|nr:rRNA maturation RNase YbeY [Spirochaeta sp.]
NEQPTEPYLGDIALSLPVIEDQAKEFSVPFHEEVLRMLVHGILHLTGHTHRTNDFASEAMLILQEDIVRHMKEKQL